MLTPDACLPPAPEPSFFFSPRSNNSSMASLTLDINGKKQLVSGALGLPVPVFSFVSPSLLFNAALRVVFRLSSI
jgi:hypothetical protein